MTEENQGNQVQVSNVQESAVPTHVDQSQKIEASVEMPIEAPKPPDLEIATPIEFAEGAPVYWVIFAPNGNLRMFTVNKEKARSSSIEWGLPAHPFCQVKKQS